MNGSESATAKPVPATNHLKAAALSVVSSIHRKLENGIQGRIVHSAVRTVQTAVNSPLALSAWGDNDIVYVPNIRVQDVAVMVLTHYLVTVIPFDLWSDSGVASVVDFIFGFGSGSTVAVEVLVNWGVIADSIGQEVLKSTYEKVIETALTGSPENVKSMDHINLRTVRIKSLMIRGVHKQLYSTADVAIYVVDGRNEPRNSMKSRAWFAPWVTASNRYCLVPRWEGGLLVDPSVVMVFGPVVDVDADLGRALILQSAHRLIWGGSEIEKLGHKAKERVDMKTYFKNLLDEYFPKAEKEKPRRRHFIMVGAVGIGSYMGLWESCHCPGEVKMNFILFDGCPCLVFPTTWFGSDNSSAAEAATPEPPTIAWSTQRFYDLWKMNDAQRQTHADNLFTYLSQYIDFKLVSDKQSEEDGQRIVRTSLYLLISSIAASESFLKVCRLKWSKTDDEKSVSKSKFDSERSGIIFVRI
ncbi:uncharacterized protein BJ171DRAFT_188330 [Polychytrium aggregatum]|uniref:uncharacterized protein n=1 Tax=Polychytrium aggregatum TaxID=110093 RepID=UPI0022FDBE83|nr:uncharacterized protein BJ171DRAFT_188330 [Polychytrium aggregatum]KAI9202262.1 hypothetical protein BJ171DRAFT_188330 [Polychytrium aggregatum]